MDLFPKLISSSAGERWFCRVLGLLTGSVPGSVVRVCVWSLCVFSPCWWVSSACSSFPPQFKSTHNKLIDVTESVSVKPPALRPKPCERLRSPPPQKSGSENKWMRTQTWEPQHAQPASENIAFVIHMMSFLLKIPGSTWDRFCCTTVHKVNAVVLFSQKNKRDCKSF